MGETVGDGSQCLHIAVRHGFVCYVYVSLYHEHVGRKKQLLEQSLWNNLTKYYD
jgi:hypothetical protein